MSVVAGGAMVLGLVVVAHAAAVDVWNHAIYDRHWQVYLLLGVVYAAAAGVMVEPGTLFGVAAVGAIALVVGAWGLGDLLMVPGAMLYAGGAADLYLQTFAGAALLYYVLHMVFGREKAAFIPVFLTAHIVLLT